MKLIKTITLASLVLLALPGCHKTKSVEPSEQPIQQTERPVAETPAAPQPAPEKRPLPAATDQVSDQVEPAVEVPVANAEPEVAPTPDESASDAPTPDEPASDAPTPDEPASDAPTPDEPASDVLVPEEPAPGEETSASVPVEDKAEATLPSVPAPEPQTELRVKDVLRSLKNTDHFARNTAEHIFNGSVNAKNQATGYHYDPIPDSDGRISGKKGTPNKFGVYEAAVTVRGIKKHRNSSFFPDTMMPQEVVDSINTAYEHRKPTTNRDEAYYGYTKSGMCIQMFVDSTNNKITSAFPKYNNAKCSVY